MDGMELLKKVHSKDPDMAVVLSVPLPAAAVGQGGAAWRRLRLRNQAVRQ